MVGTSSRGDTAVDSQAAWSTMRADRRFLWSWLTIATTLSVAGNIGHAWLAVGVTASRWMAIGWAVAPPALLMLAIHGLPTLARMLGSGDRDKMLTAVVWGVTIGAFGWSAFGLFGFTSAMGIPGRLAWLAPLVIDLSVFGATRGLVLTAPLAARMRAAVPSHHSDAALDPTTDAVQPAAATQRLDSVSTQLDADGADLPTALTDATSQAMSGTPASTTPPSPAADPFALAKDIVDSGAVRKPVDTVAAVLVAAADEHRKAVIAEQTGVHHSVVTRILGAAESHRRGELVAVGSP